MCQSPVQTLLLLGWGMFPCKAQCLSPTPWCSQHSQGSCTARGHLQAPSSRKWRELLFSFSPSRSVLQTLSYSMQRQVGLSPAVFCDKKGGLDMISRKESMITNSRWEQVFLHLRAKFLHLFAGPCYSPCHFLQANLGDCSLLALVNPTYRVLPESAQDSDQKWIEKRKR